MLFKSIKVNMSDIASLLNAINRYVFTSFNSSHVTKNQKIYMYKQIKFFLFSPTKCTPQIYKAAHYNVME